SPVFILLSRYSLTTLYMGFCLLVLIITCYIMLLQKCQQLGQDCSTEATRAYLHRARFASAGQEKIGLG
ncbi:hypothetical protein, partial [Pseudothermotoga sp.]